MATDKAMELARVSSEAYWNEYGQWMGEPDGDDTHTANEKALEAAANAIDKQLATPPPASADAMGEVERARKICAEVEGPNKGYQYLDGTRDDYPMMRAVLAALSAMSPAGEVERIVAWLREQADDVAPPETEGSDPLWTVHAFVHGMANQIERGDFRHD